MHPAFRLWRPVPRSEDHPKLAESGPLEGHALSDTQRFPAVCRPYLLHSPELAEGGSHDDHTVAGTGCFRGSGGALATSPSILGGCGRIRTYTAVTPSRGSSPISTPMRASKVAESSELESHAIADALGLANRCEPCPLYSPELVPRVANCTDVTLLKRQVSAN